MLCVKLPMPTTRSSEMIEASGGVVNFIAILVPTLMALYFGFRCLFLSIVVYIRRCPTTVTNTIMNMHGGNGLG